MRLGRIPWINASPVYSAIDRGLVPGADTVVSATAAELNDLMANRELDLSVVSAVEYARDAESYLLLPDLAISCDGPVHSVALFSNLAPEQLDGARVLVSSSSRTSVLLLELLCRHRWGVAPRFEATDAEPADLPALTGTPHDAVLVIGDAALQLRHANRYSRMVDLGQAWKEWTGMPFVFAVWVAQRDSDRSAALQLHTRLLASREWGLANLDLLARDASVASGMPFEMVRAYLGDLDYSLTSGHLSALSKFFNLLASERLVPEGNFSFLTAA